jgi:multicomponent Na+:H+ antiporter subunit F
MVGIDIFGVLVVGVCALLVLKSGRDFIIDIAITWAILSFIGTITLAKYLSGKKLND